jgi:LuxR family maltose regulon positive regulatory protein
MSLDYLRRNRLLDLLDTALASPLTLVSAPAGYGKSELLCDWVRKQNSPVAWISLDRHDSVLRQFLSYLIATLEGVSPGACPEIRNLLSGPELAPIAVVGRHLINDLDAFDEPCVIVLDDYYRLEYASPVHELLEILLAYPPPGMRLVLITRIDPPLPLTRLRAGNRVAEIRLQDLRFTRSETTAFFSMQLDRRVTEAAIDNLQREVEGWAVGLRLVCLALRYASDPDAVLRGLRGGIPQTQEYLLNEVLKELSPGVRDCLLKSSILDRFCAELIDVVCCDASQAPSELSGQTFIDLLQHQNLFSISLDSEGRWFRFHHLFQLILQRQLELQHAPSDIEKLHLSASAWLEARAQNTEAIAHALAASDVEGAAAIVERRRFDKLDQDQSFIVAQWLDLLPAAIKHERLGLLIAATWVAYYQFRFADIAAGVERIEARVDDDALDALSLSELNWFRAFLAYWQGDAEKARRCSELALAASPERSGAFAGEIRNVVALARHMTGDGDAAIQFLEAEGIAAGSVLGDPFHTRMFAAQAIIHMLCGRLMKAARAAAELKNAANRCQTAYTQGWAHYMQALPDLQMFELEAAHRHFLLAKEHAIALERIIAVDTLAGLALVDQLLGRPDDAGRTVDELMTFAHATGDREYMAAAESCRARVALLQGDPQAAMAWVKSVDAAPHAPSMFIWLHAPCLTRARIQIAAGGEDDLREAIETLGALRQDLATLHVTCQVVEVTALQALALAKQGRVTRALNTLQDAVALAMPGDWIRPFIELGLPMAELLERLGRSAVEGDFIDRLLATYKIGSAPALARQVPTDAPPKAQLGAAPSDLTNREVDILDLLSQRLQNKEIATKLYISPHTVKDHLKRIYQKLGVRGRRQAVRKAQDTGLLPTP